MKATAVNCNHVAAVVILVVVVTMMKIGHGQAQQQQPPPGTACGNTFFSSLVQMIPCRAAVAPFSPIPPSEACCTAVKSLGQPCLCFLINGPPLSGIDRNMALQLPLRCAANFPPCDVMN